jgi:hypothetical protein
VEKSTNNGKSVVLVNRPGNRQVADKAFHATQSAYLHLAVAKVHIVASATFGCVKMGEVQPTFNAPLADKRFMRVAVNDLNDNLVKVMFIVVVVVKSFHSSSSYGSLNSSAVIKMYA